MLGNSRNFYCIQGDYSPSSAFRIRLELDYYPNYRLAWGQASTDRRPCPKPIPVQ